MFVRFRQLFLQLYFLVNAALFAVLMMVGIWRHYSDIPFLDMWDAYLGFYTRVGKDWHAWWEQHNEHRLIVSRLLFWTDLRIFGGSMTLLYVLNAVFPLLIAGSFVFLLQRLRRDAGRRNVSYTALAALMVVLATSWVQSENFTWAFQSQFFLAYLLPLLAFILLAHAQVTSRRYGFWLAWLAGLVSAGTMANGTLALPLLVIQGWVLHLRKRDIGVLLLTAALVLGLYFYDYHTLGLNVAPQGSVSIIEHSKVMFIPYGALLHAVDDLDFARYVLLFLGGPWYFILQKIAVWPAIAAGAMWLVLALVAAWQVLRRQPVQQPYSVALLVLMAYLVAAALGAAHGRIVLGVEQALSSRYLTPQLMAWAALLLLGVHLWPSVTTSRLALCLYAVIPLLLFPAQWQGARKTPEYLMGLRIPALAIQLGVRDFEQIQRMSYDGERTFALAEQARHAHLAVFGEPNMRLAQQYWSGGRFVEQIPQTHCEGHVDTIEPISGVPDVMRVRGWLYDPQRQQAPSLVLLSGAEHGRGVALGGIWWPDGAQTLNKPGASTAGFGGYLQKTALAGNGLVTLTGWIGQRPVCTVTFALRQ